MKVIKHGKKPSKTISFYKIVCSDCKCEFEFKSEEMFSRYRQMFGDIGTVICPDCGKLQKVRDKDFVGTMTEEEAMKYERE